MLGLLPVRDMAVQRELLALAATMEKRVSAPGRPSVRSALAPNIPPEWTRLLGVGPDSGFHVTDGGLYIAPRGGQGLGALVTKDMHREKEAKGPRCELSPLLAHVPSQDFVLSPWELARPFEPRRLFGTIPRPDPENPLG